MGNKTAIKKVKVNKIPYNMKGKFKDAVIAGLVGVAIEKGGEVIVYVYDDIKGPLGDFLNNAPNTMVQVGHSTVELAEEAFDEVTKAGGTVVSGVEKGGKAVTFAVVTGAETIAHEVEYFVVHTIGDPVVHELENFGNVVNTGAMETIII